LYKANEIAALSDEQKYILQPFKFLGTPLILYFRAASRHDNTCSQSPALFRVKADCINKLYAEWCKRYDIRPRTAISFGREMTPYMLKGWVDVWQNHQH
jgi:hypothetical protein